MSDQGAGDQCLDLFAGGQPVIITVGQVFCANAGERGESTFHFGIQRLAVESDGGIQTGQRDVERGPAVVAVLGPVGKEGTGPSDFLADFGDVAGAVTVAEHADFRPVERPRHAEDHFHERGLACAVGPQDEPAFPAFHPPVEIVQDGIAFQFQSCIPDQQSRIVIHFFSHFGSSPLG